MSRGLGDVYKRQVINTGKEADTYTIEIKIGEIRLRVVIGADVGNCAGKGILRGDFGGERFARHARQNPLIADSFKRLAERHRDEFSIPVVGITGSNGKTTTTSLIYHILTKAGIDAGLAGNIGNSLALQVAENPHPWYVIELSSFQLDNMYDFKADIAILLNITPDHLDRYDFKMQNYTDAKMRITQNQTKDDALIYWSGDPIITEELKKRSDIGGELCPFSENDFTLNQDECCLKGRHNIYNMMAAKIACEKAGIAEDVIIENIKNFRGVEHRLEKIGSVNGVEFINDSKATNVDACYFALESIKGKCVLILGGVDKGNDYNEITPLVKEKCSALVFLGVDNSKLHRSFDSLNLPIADTSSMADCVKACAQLAKPGETVLLSPCCASFDLFKNMEDRGEQFKENFKKLKENK